MQLLYIRPHQGEQATIETNFPNDTVIAATEVHEVTPEMRNTITMLSVFVDYQVTAEVLDLLPNLQFIATRSAGYDHIDTASAKARGITISRVPHYGTRTVAEYAIALLFALSRNAFKAYTDMQQTTHVGSLDQYEGFDIAGKTLGVIGTGAIGKNVCEIARGLGMHVLAYDVAPDTDWADEHQVSYHKFEDVLSSAHIVTLHVPAIPQTHHLMNAAAFAAMQPGSYLINTARGEIVDTTALIEALERGHLAGAGLDVLEGEHALQEEAELLTREQVDSALWQTLTANHALIDMPNVIVTPHIAFNTTEAKREITEITCANIKAFVAGQPQNTI